MPQEPTIDVLIVRYLQQEILKEDLEYLNNWIHKSEDNKHHFFTLKKLHESLTDKQWSEEEVEESWQSMRAKLERADTREQPASIKRNRFYLRIARYAAIVGAAVLMGWGVEHFTGIGSRLNSKESLTYNEVYVEKGGKPNLLILSDGSEVRLNAATNFRYPTDFSKEKREVYLNGEAFFNVSPDMEKPFIVNMKQQNITVLGTEFNIEAYHTSSHSIVTLLSGKISLQTFNKEGETISQVLMKPNQKVFFDFKSETVTVENVDASLSKVWINGEYKFKDEPLQLIIDRLEKYYNVDIHVEDEELQKIRYTGTFSLNQRISEVLHIINYEKQFVYKQAGHDIFITPR